MQLEEALQLAWQQLDRFGLTAKGWTVNFDEGYRILGHCCYHVKAITLSQLHVEQNNRENVLNTILHEIAHALVGPGHGHDMVWQAKARSVGARPSAFAACGVSRSTKPNVICL